MLPVELFLVFFISNCVQESERECSFVTHIFLYALFHFFRVRVVLTQMHPHTGVKHKENMCAEGNCNNGTQTERHLRHGDGGIVEFSICANLKRSIEMCLTLIEIRGWADFDLNFYLVIGHHRRQPHQQRHTHNHTKYFFTSQLYKMVDGLVATNVRTFFCVRVIFFPHLHSIDFNYVNSRDSLFKKPFAKHLLFSFIEMTAIVFALFDFLWLIFFFFFAFVVIAVRCHHFGQNTNGNRAISPFCTHTFAHTHTSWQTVSNLYRYF